MEFGTHCWVFWDMPVISILGRLKEENKEFCSLTSATKQFLTQPGLHEDFKKMAINQNIRV